MSANEINPAARNVGKNMELHVWIIIHVHLKMTVICVIYSYDKDINMCVFSQHTTTWMSQTR